MGEREEDDLEPKRPLITKTKENTENEAGLYRGYAPHGWGWPQYPSPVKPIRPTIGGWGPGLGAYGLPGLGGLGWGGLGGWGWPRPSLFGWLF